MRELLKLLNEPPILERISPECCVLSATRVYYRICRADNTSPGRDAACALPHTHGVVHNVTRKYFLVIAFILTGTVLLVCVGLSFNAVVYCAASFGSFLENVAYSYLSPRRPRFAVSIHHTTFLPEDSTMQSSFMLLEEFYNLALRGDSGIDEGEKCCDMVLFLNACQTHFDGCDLWVFEIPSVRG